MIVQLVAETDADLYPASIMKRFSSPVAGFAFTSREYISQQLPMTASVT